jgi:DNA-directed RNA polymerase specialized sigma24 family protein
LGKVRLAFHDLTPRDQGIVGMSVVTGMGSEEMARRTGMSPMQVRQRKSRAIRRMRAQVDLQML